MISNLPFRGIGRTIILSTFVFALLIGCRNEPQALVKFAGTYAQLHNAGDVDGLMELIDIQGDDPKIIRQVRLALTEETRWPVKSVRFEPIENEDVEKLSATLSAAPQWRFIVTLDTEDRFTSVWLAGETGEGIRLLLPGS